MRRFQPFIVFVFIIGITCAGCAARNAVLPLHDEVLKFDLPYDLAYLRTVEALEKVEGWELQQTEKEKGVIVVRNINFSSFADADQRNATFLMNRIGSRETSVQLAPHSQRIIGGEDLLRQVSRYLERESNK